MNGVWLTGSALTISLFLLIIFLVKKNVKNNETIIYQYLVIANFLFSCTGFFGYLFSKTIGNEVIVGTIQRLHLIILMFITFLLVCYNLGISKLKDNTKKNIYHFFLVFLFIAAFLVLFVPIKVINYGEYLDVGGLGYLIAITNVIFSFCMISILIITYFIQNKNDYKKTIPFIVLIFLYIFALLLRIWYPEIITETYISAFAILVMYFTIENPDVRLIKELEIAKDEANKANLAKTEFLSNMSHEIRTPLNAIVNFSDCIVDAKTLQEAKENASDIVKASATLLEIVNSILDISKIEAGKLVITESVYDAKEVFLELAKLITPRMKEKNLDFTYDITPDLPQYLYGDYANLKKIVTNLLSNACKYTDSGYVHYRISCENISDTCKLNISVEDSGRGIKKENITKLFTKFERLEENKNSSIEGTGLGLALTKQLIELMGGKITVSTVYNEGSTFTVTLEQKIAAKENDSVKQDSFVEEDFSGLRLIVVDDNEMNLKVCKKLLERFSVTDCLFLNSGYELIDKIKSGYKADAILLDIMMPQMDGTATLKQLKEIAGFDMIVIALTANALNGSEQAYLNSGFSYYLAKPIEKQNLAKVLSNVKRTKKDEKLSYNEKELEDNEKELQDNEQKTQDKEPAQNIALDIKEPPSIDAFEYLKSKGVDMDKALELLGDMDMYNETIKDFLEEIQEKWSRIEKYKLEGNMDDYAIDVHSLKSDCKYLGFTTLADISYQHELSSKAKDITFVNNNFLVLEEEFDKVYKIVEEYVKTYLK